MHACPPISSDFTSCFRIVERTLCIGVWVKRSSEGHVCGPEPRALLPSFGGSQAVPFGPFGLADILRLDSFHIRKANVWNLGVNGHLHAAHVLAIEDTPADGTDEPNMASSLMHNTLS